MNAKSDLSSAVAAEDHPTTACEEAVLAAAVYEPPLTTRNKPK